ncbi:MAG: O-antigen ligase family protein [Clostridia bacterium]|nr:O-antigen ligase family protein [Clostridia bacterium]
MPYKRVLPYGVEDAEPQRPKKVPPRFVTFIAILCTVIAGLGDWGVLNRMLKGLPKAVALGTIACAVLNYLVDADFVNIKKALSYLPLYMLLIAVYTSISMYIWLMDLSKVSSISAGAQKILFQAITIIYAICMCYLFEDRAINFLFLGMVITNGSIMLLEMPKYGIANSILSVITCVITFGGASGFVRAMEIHDITFLFGQFLIYYMMFAPRKTPTERKRRYICIGFCIFFMLVGLKRSTLPAVAMMCIYVKVLRMFKKPEPLMLATGIGLFLFSYVYVYLARTGIMVDFLESMGIEMLGRDKLWTLPNDYYEFSPFWKGLGFEGVDDLIKMFYQAGLITSTFPLHNDFLRIFIELGAIGFTLWGGIHYILYPLYWMKRYDTETCMLYMALVCYMTVTYLTDNTAFYFWCSIGLRTIPMSYSYRIYKAEKIRRWKAPTVETAADLIWDIETGG